jgi:hypothetical protein
MTAYQLRVVGLNEITSVAVTCRCGIVVDVPLATLIDKPASIPKQCACGTGFDDNLIHTLSGLRQALKESRSTGFKVVMHLKTANGPAVSRDSGDGT